MIKCIPKSAREQLFIKLTELGHADNGDRPLSTRACFRKSPEVMEQSH